MTGRDYEYKRINNMNDILQELREPLFGYLLIIIKIQTNDENYWIG